MTACPSDAEVEEEIRNDGCQPCLMVWEAGLMLEPDAVVEVLKLY
jgi:hypothetical protein